MRTVSPLANAFSFSIVGLLAVLLLGGPSVPQPARGQGAFIITWATTSANESITIPTNGGFNVTDYDFEIDWGDGTVETVIGDDPDPSHTYAAAGTYTVAITGTFPHFYVDDLFNSDPQFEQAPIGRAVGHDSVGKHEVGVRGSRKYGAECDRQP